MASYAEWKKNKYSNSNDVPTTTTHSYSEWKKNKYSQNTEADKENEAAYDTDAGAKKIERLKYYSGKAKELNDIMSTSRTNGDISVADAVDRKAMADLQKLYEEYEKEFSASPIHSTPTTVQPNFTSGIAGVNAPAKPIDFDSLLAEEQKKYDSAETKNLYSTILADPNYEAVMKKADETPAYRQGLHTVRNRAYVSAPKEMLDTFTSTNDEFDSIIPSFMTEEEKTRYKWLWGNGEYDKAEEYYQSIKSDLEERAHTKAIQNTYQQGKEHPGFTSAQAVVRGGLAAPVEAITDTAKLIKDTFTDPDNVKLDRNQTMELVDAANYSVSEDMSPAGRFLYNTAMSGAQSLLSATAFGKLGGVAMALSAAGSAVNDGLDRGMTDVQAMQYGIAAGVFEGLFETWSIGHFLKEIPADTIRVALVNIAKSMGVNASEEWCTEVANIIYDTIAHGELSRAQQMIAEGKTKGQVIGELALQTVEAAGSGALMGAGFSSVNNINGVGANVADAIEKGKEAKNKGITNDLIDAGMRYEGTEAYKLAEKASKRATNYRVGRLSQVMTKSAMQSTFAKETGNTETAKALTDIVMGKEVGNSDIARILADEKSLSALNNVLGTNIASGTSAKEVKSAVKEAVGRQTDDMVDSLKEDLREPVRELVKGNIISDSKIEAVLKDKTATAILSLRTGIEINDKTTAQDIKEAVTNAANDHSRARLALVYAASLDMGENGAKGVARMIGAGSSNIASAVQAYNAVYRAGRSGKAITEAKNPYLSELTLAERMAAYEYGVMDSLSNNPNAEYDTDKAVNLKGGEVATPVKNLTRSQQSVVDAGKTIGVNVVIAKVEKNGKNIDGLFDGETLYINPDPNSGNPMFVLVKHELTHFTEKALDKYADFAKAVTDSAAFAKWLRSKGYDGVDSYLDMVIKNYKDIGKNYEGDAGRKKAHKEMVANFVADTLYGGDEGFKRFTNELSEDHRRTLGDIIRDFIDWIKKKLGISDEVKTLEKRYAELFKEAKRSDAKGEETQLLYVGEKSETADRLRLSAAQDMITKGVDSETVRKETGWFKGYDGKWRFEINDKDMEYSRNGFNPDYLRYKALELKFLEGTITDTELKELQNTSQDIKSINLYRLDQFVKHDELFKAYPELRRLKVSFDSNIKGNGAFYRDTFSIKINPKADDIKKTLLHEIQHAVQFIEGFTGGTDVKEVSPEVKNRVYILKEEQKKVSQELEAIYKEIGFEEYSDSLWEKAWNMEIDPDTIESLEEQFLAEKSRKGLALYNYQKQVIEMVKEAMREESAPYDQYLKTAGEIEARDVANRADMTSEERKNTRPDIDREDVIFADGVTSYAIKRNSKGEEYWEIDSGKDIFKGLSNPDEYRDAAFAYLISNRDNKVIVKDKDGREIVFIRVSAEEFTNSDESRDLFVDDPEIFKQKMRLIPSLDDILLHANVNWHSPDHKNHRLFKKGGFENYRGKVRIDNVIFNTIVRVGHAYWGDVFYDINLEVAEYLPHTTTNSASDMKKATSNGNIIPQNSNLSTPSSKNSSDDTQASYTPEKSTKSDEWFEKLKDHSSEKYFVVDGYGFYIGRAKSSNWARVTVKLPDGTKLSEGISGGKYYTNQQLWRIASQMATGEYVPEEDTAYDGNTKSKTRSGADRADLVKSLETIVESDEDKEILKWYKSEIAMVEADQKKLKAIQRKIKKISRMPSLLLKSGERITAEQFEQRALNVAKVRGFKESRVTFHTRKGMYVATYDGGDYEADVLTAKKIERSAETKAELDRLKVEADKLAMTIKNHDSELLNLEANSAMSRLVRQIEKDAFLAGKIEQGKKDASVLRHAKEDAQKLRDARDKKIEDKKVKTVKENIKEVVKKLDSMLRTESKEKHIHYGMKEVVRDSLLIIDFSPEKENKFAEDLAKIDDQIKKLADLGMTTSAEYSKLITQRAKLQDRKDNFREKLERTKKAYEEVSTGADSEKIPAYYKEEAQWIVEVVDEVMQKVGHTAYEDMNLEQLTRVYEMYKAILTRVKNANKVFRDGKLEDLVADATAMEHDLDSVKKLDEERWKFTDKAREFIWNELTPYYAFSRIGSQKLMEYYWDIVRGQDTYARDIKEATKFAKDARKKYGYNKWDMDNVYTIKDKNGKDFRLTLKHMMSIYAYSKREQAEDHMSIGGFFFNDSDTFVKKKSGLEFVKTNEQSYKVDKSVVETIVSTMDSIDKNIVPYVDTMQDYLTKMGEKGNEVTREMWGIEIFKEKHYFPLMSKDNFIHQANTPTETSSLKNDSMTKATKPHASNPIVLEAFDEVWDKHVEKMSKYHAFVIPIDNLNKLINYGTWAGEETKSISLMLSARFGNAVNQYLNNFIKDLNGAKAEKVMGWSFVPSLVSKFKKTAVAASLSVAVQQPTAVLRALSEINVKYFMHLPRAEKLNAKWDLMQEYAPIVTIKEIGGFDSGSGRSAIEVLGEDRKKGLEKAGRKIDDLTMYGAALGDRLGWASIWNAVEEEISDTTDYEKNSLEFYEAVGKRFTEVIVKTQVYDSTLSRSGFMRGKDGLIKMAMAFKGEPTLSFNMLFDAVDQARRGKISKKQAVQSIAAVYSSIIAATLVKSLIYALRDEDEDESYFEKYFQAVGGNIFSDTFLLSMLPLFSDVMSIIEGYDVERSDMAVVADLVDAVKNLDSESRTTYRKIEDLAGAMGGLIGIPVSNIMRTFREGYNVFENIFDGVDFGDVRVAFKEGVTGKEMSKSESLYNAVMNNDTARIEVYRKNYKDEDAYKSALKKSLRENDPRVVKSVEQALLGNYTMYNNSKRSLGANKRYGVKLVNDAFADEREYVLNKLEEARKARKARDMDEYNKIIDALVERGYSRTFIMKKLK